jgi:predicted thioredoxin/glutaredoxin
MSSYRLVKDLHSRGLLGEVSLRNTSRGLDTLARGVVSVPWVTYRGEPVAADPVSAGEVEDILESGRTRVEKDPVRLFIRALVSSSFIASQVLLHRDVSVALDESFLKAALRSGVGGPEPGAVISEIGGSGREVYEQVEPMLARSLAYSYVREILWAKGLDGSIDLGSIARAELVGAWLIAKASVGRVFLPDKPLISGHAGVEALTSVLLEKGEHIAKSVREEQEMILGDTEYWALLEKHAR